MLSLRYLLFLAGILLISALLCSCRTQRIHIQQDQIERLSKEIEFIKSRPIISLEEIDSVAKANRPKDVDPRHTLESSDIVESPFKIVKINFATNRNVIGGNEKFGRERGNMSYGQCFVSIPRNHTMGEVEGTNISWLEDANRHFKISNITTESNAQFFHRLSSSISNSGKKSAFIYVHGYKNSFSDAAKRAAQIHYDLKFSGAPVMFSWPSKDEYLEYKEDARTIAWAQSYLEQFLKDFFQKANAEKVYIIAHSMGSLGVSNAIKNVVATIPTLSNRLEEIILAAPDISADIFKTSIAPGLIKSSKRVTIYSSSTDLALQMSRRFNGYPALGDNLEGVVVIPGIETIDATDIDASFIGHSYFSNSRTILQDMHYLIEWGFGAKDRHGLEEISRQNLYWKFVR